MLGLAGPAGASGRQVVGHSPDGSTNFVLTREALTPDDTDVCPENPYGPRCEDIFAVSPARTRLVTPVTGVEAPPRFAGSSIDGEVVLYFTGAECGQPAGCGRLHRYDGAIHLTIGGDDPVLRSYSPGLDRVVVSSRARLADNDPDGPTDCPRYGPGQPLSYGCADLYEWSFAGYRLLPPAGDAEAGQQPKRKHKAEKRPRRKRAGHPGR